MNNPIVGGYVGGYNCGVANLNAIAGVNGQALTTDRWGRSHTHHIRCHHLARDDMVQQNGFELIQVFWLEQALDGSGRQSRERIIGRREHGERACAFQRLHQTGSLHGSNKGLERTSTNRNINNISHLENSFLTRGPRDSAPPSSTPLPTDNSPDFEVTPVTATHFMITFGRWAASGYRRYLGRPQVGCRGERLGYTKAMSEMYTGSLPFLATAGDADRITQETIDKYQKYVNPAALNLLKLGGFDKIEATGCGATIRDLHGVEYIDCLGGYGVFSLGHANPRVIEAVYAQMRRLPLSTKTFLNKPLADLSERLAQLSPGDLQYSFISNSGAEAIEAAIKFARMATGRHHIVSAIGSYHGKTLGALSASGRELYKTPFAPLLPGFTQVTFGDTDALRAAVDSQTAAVFLEPIQGENGIRVAPDGYLQAARAICNETGALLLLDEVQTGLGRTGKMWASEHWGVVPDMMTLAKALGGGVVPIGATLATPAVWERVFRENPFIHTSTFGGNEMACVAALTALAITIEDDLPAQAARKGERLLTGLRDVQHRYPDLLQETRGMGLMIGVEFKDADIGKLAIGALVHNGVIAAYTLNNAKVMRFEPPLVITDAQIEQVIHAFDRAMHETQELLADLLG